MSNGQSITPTWSIPADVVLRSINGYPMVYQEFGEGLPVVLIHGSVTDYRYWARQAAVFSKQYRVVVPGLRHYYPEQWDARTGRFSIEQHANDTATLIETLALGRVHLVGHSRGGAVALHFARTHPKLVRTLILADGSGSETLLPKTPEGQRQTEELVALMASVRATYQEKGPKAACILFVDSVNGKGAWDGRNQEDHQRTIDNIGTVIGDPATRPPLTCEDVRGFDFPALFLTGERSPKRYCEMMNAMHRCNPRLPITITVPNASHAMNKDNPIFFEETILTFLNAH